MSKPIKALCKPGVLPAKPKIQSENVEVELKKTSEENNNVLFFIIFLIFMKKKIGFDLNGLIIFIRNKDY